MDDTTSDLPPDPIPAEAASRQAAEDAQAGKRMALGGIIISLFLFLGKIAGYAKSMLISGYFGTDARTDAYMAIYNNLIYGTYTNLEKVLRPAYLPQFVRDRNEQGEPRAWRLTSLLVNLEFLAVVVLVVLFELFAPQIVRFMWQEMADDPVGFSVSVALLRLMAPLIIPLSLSLMPELTLHAYKQFTLPAVAEFVMRVGTVAGIALGVHLLWSPDHPQAIMATAVGALLGCSLRLLVMLPGLGKRLLNWRPVLNPLDSPSARVVFSLMPPLLVGMAAAYLRNYFDSRFATAIGTGMYTSLVFGRTMGDSALQILPLAVSFVVYPFLSEWAARGDKDKLAEALVRMTRIMAFIFVPISVAMMFLARPIITIIYEHGQMTATAADFSALALFCYAPGLLFFALEASINKWYFALQDTKTPNYWGAAMALLHILIGYVGVVVLWQGGRIGDAGALAAVALALSVSKSAKVVILYGLIRRRLGHIAPRPALLFTAKLGLATVAMGLVIYVITTTIQPSLTAWQPPFAANKLRMLALAAAVGIGGGGVFLVSAALLKIEEFTMVAGLVAGKVRARLGR